MQAISAILNVTEQINHVLSQLEPHEYRKQLPEFEGNTLGMHFRHILEFFQCLEKGLAESGMVDYASRQRNLLYEDNPKIAAAAFTAFAEALPSLNASDNIDVKAEFGGLERPSYSSTVGRELLFVYDHAIHHLAMIKIGLLCHFPHVNTDKDRVSYLPRSKHGRRSLRSCLNYSHRVKRHFSSRLPAFFPSIVTTMNLKKILPDLKTCFFCLRQNNSNNFLIIRQANRPDQRSLSGQPEFFEIKMVRPVETVFLHPAPCAATVSPVKRLQAHVRPEIQFLQAISLVKTFLCRPEYVKKVKLFACGVFPDKGVLFLFRNLWARRGIFATCTCMSQPTFCPASKAPTIPCEWLREQYRSG